ncbi:hypothetical protein D915_000719 [Fasciola hepatica]|uniref:Ionotropic glutamate receptor C-terminal domain-containing protein n=1 Tax=Fasciola hepatica TaxID=6192 RepID=A0A4E0RNI5_FASHE|nr:hypothetical protein D915_000719 [Fasciola hepatica]
MKSSGFNLAAEFQNVCGANSHSLCTTLKPDECKLIPNITFDVRFFANREVDQLIKSNVSAIISLTSCDTANQIEYICSLFGIPHLAIPKPTCDEQVVTPKINATVMNDSGRWNSTGKPWVVLNRTLVVEMLRAVDKMERSARTMVFTDGDSGLPPALLLSETKSTLAERLSEITSTHLFKMSNHSKAPKNAKLLTLYLQWIRNTSNEWGASVLSDHFTVFTPNYDIKHIVQELLDYCLLNMNNFWVIAEQSDHPPFSVTELLSTPSTQGNCSHQRANLAMVRRFSLQYLVQILTKSGSRAEVNYFRQLGRQTDRKPERFVIATFLAFGLSKAYVNLISHAPNSSKDDPLSFGTRLRQYMYQFITSSGLNSKLYFYATNTLKSTGKSEFLMTASYTPAGLRLTPDGLKIAHEAGSSGLFPNRFRGMHGKYLRIGVVVDPPFLVAGGHASNGELLDVKGFIPDIMALLEEKFQFRCKYMESSDGEYGTFVNGTWTGLVKDLIDDRIDIAAALLTLTRNRSKHIHYLGPFLISSTAMIGARIVSDGDLFKMLRPFKGSVWIMIMFSIIITGLGVYTLNRITPFSAWNLGLPGAIPDEITAQENLWSVLSSCLLQGTEIFPLALSSRTLIVLFWTAVVIFHALWQAEMTAYMSRTYLKPSVRSLHELAYGNTFRPIAMTGSSIFVSFNTRDDPIEQAIYGKLQSGKKVRSTKEGIEAVVNDPNLVFIHDELLLRYAVSNQCKKIQLLPIHFSEAPAGFGVAPGREFEHSFSQYLSALQEKGIIDRLLSKWWFALNVCKDKGAQYKQMNLLDISGAIIILMVAISCSLLVLISEQAYVRWIRPKLIKCMRNKVIAMDMPEITITECNSLDLRDPCTSRRSSMLINVLPDPIANDFRYGGRRRATCAHNASAINLQT